MQNISFFARLSMAIKLIFSGRYAQELVGPVVQPEEQPAAPAAELLDTDSASALQLLALMQKEGRLLDFINEDINAFGDEQVAGAARVVHQGVKAVFDEHLSLSAVAQTGEGEAIQLDGDFDKSQYRLTGNIAGDGPYNGTLIHKGWQVDELTLPQVAEGTNLNIVAAAEVDL